MSRAWDKEKSESPTGFEPMTSEASWKLSSTSDWLMSAKKNVGYLKQVTLLGSLL